MSSQIEMLILLLYFQVINLIIMSTVGQVPNPTTNETDIVYDPNLNMCFDGVPNVVVTMPDGSTLIFKDYSFWKMTDNYTNVSEPFSIDEHFPELPPILDIGFTVWSEVNEWTDTYQRTLFGKVSVKV